MDKETVIVVGVVASLSHDALVEMASQSEALF